MRTGAIFARGSCRALKWVALVGMVFALGAGQALAQAAIEGGVVTKFEITGAEERVIGTKRQHVGEGDITTVAVTVRWTHAQVTTAWGGQTVVRPEPASVTVVPAALTGDDGENGTTRVNQPWLSAIELGAAGHMDDVILPQGSVISVRVPNAPTSNPTSTVHTIDSTGSISISFSEDPDAEDEGFSLALGTPTGIALSTPAESIAAVVIEDDETQGVSLERKTKGTVWEGGDSQEFEAEADPARVDLPLRVRYDLTDSEGVSLSSRTYSLDEAIGTIMPGADMTDMVTLNVASNDGNREDDALEMHAEVVSLSLASGAFDDIETDSVPFTVVDIHKLPEVTISTDDEDVVETGSVMEGDTIELTLMVDRNPRNTIVTDDEERQHTSEEVTVMLAMADGSTASSSDYRIMTNPVTIPEHNKKAPWVQEMTVEVMALEDDVLDPDEMLILMGEVSGTEVANGDGTSMSENMVSLAIEEGTAKYVWAKTEDEVYAALMGAKGDGDFTPGMSFEIMGSSLFNAAEGVTLGFTASSDDMDIASTSVASGMVMVTAGYEAGTAKITVTAHASMPSSVDILDQDDPREASVLFPVEVTLAALTYSVMDPENHNLVEGMDHANGTKASAMVKVRASRPLAGDETAEIMLMRDGSSSATMDDFTVMPEMVMLEAGDEMAEFTVMAVEDDMPDGGVGMPEIADSLPGRQRHADERPVGDVLHLGHGRSGAADHRPAPAGGAPRARRVSAVSAAVGGGVRNSPLAPSR